MLIECHPRDETTPAFVLDMETTPVVGDFLYTEFVVWQVEGRFHRMVEEAAPPPPGSAIIGAGNRVRRFHKMFLGVRAMTLAALPV